MLRFEQPVIPPAEIVIRSQDFVRWVGGLHQFTVTAAVGSMVVSRGTITLTTSPVEAVAVGGRG